MVKHAPFAFVLGVLTGVLGLWAFQGALREEPRPRTAERTLPPAAHARPRATPSSRAELSDEAAAILERVSFASEEEGASGNAAVATLLALGGRTDEFLRAAGAALSDGADPDHLLDVAWLLPEESAADAVEELLRLHPDAGWDYAYAAGPFLSHGLRDRGLAVLRMGLGGVGDDTDLVLVWLHEDPEGGAAELLPSAERWSPGVLQAAASALIDAEHGALAIPFLRLALARVPRDDEVLGLLAGVDPVGARVHAERRIEEDTEDAAAWGVLGRLRADAGDTEGALAAYREQLVRSPEPESLWAVYELARARSLPILTEAVKDSRDDEAIGTVARAYFDDGQREAAFREYRRALALDPSDPEWLRALVHIDAGRAMETIGTRVRSAPQSVSDEEAGAYAQALMAAGRANEAFDYFRLALRKDGGDPEWREGIALADPERAIPVLRDMAAKDPDDASLQGALAVALGGAGQQAAALALFRRIEDPEEWVGWCRGMARFAPVEVVARLREGIANNPEDDEIWGNLAKVERDLGHRAEALDALRRALELDPGDGEWRDLERELR